MTDTIIKGTGNSRSIIIPPDAKSRYHSVDDILDAMIAGTFMVDIGPLNPAGCDVVGTANNKANLLSDATAALYGMTAQEATPDKVFRILGDSYDMGSYTGTGSPSTHEISLIFQRQPLIFCLRGPYPAEADVALISFATDNGRFSGLGMIGAYEFKLYYVDKNYYDPASKTLHIDTNNTAYVINKNKGTYNWIAIY